MAETLMLVKNQTYTQNQKIVPQYVVVHSTATGTDKIFKLYNSWNNASKTKSCHGMVDDEKFIQTLPYDCRGWHAGPNGNGISIGFEICEPKNIAYLDAAHSKIDKLNYNPANAAIRADFLKRYTNAVYMAADMCKATGIKPDKVLCHTEMNAIGKATNHADVNHWFPLFGKNFTMDAFRKDVATVLAGGKLNKTFDTAAEDDKPAASPSPDLPYKIKTDKLPLPVYATPDTKGKVTMTITAAGSFTITEESGGFGKLKSGAGWVELSKVVKR